MLNYDSDKMLVLRLLKMPLLVFGCIIISSNFSIVIILDGKINNAFLYLSNVNYFKFIFCFRLDLVLLVGCWCSMTKRLAVN